MVSTVCSRISFSRVPNCNTNWPFLRAARMSLHLLDRHHQSMRLNLLIVKLGFLLRLCGDNAFSFLMDFEHMFGGFLFCKREHFHEDENDVSHQVDRVVPDDDIPALLEGLLDLFLRDFLDFRQRLDGCHTVTRSNAPVNSPRRRPANRCARSNSQGRSKYVWLLPA